MKSLAAILAATLAAGCAGRSATPPEPAGPIGPTGFLELPLESSADDGTPVRLVGAVLQLETPTESVPVVAPSDEGVFSQALPLDLKRVTLTGPWQLEAMEAGRWHPLVGTLVSPSAWEAPSLVEGEVTEVGFRFESSLGPVNFGASR